MLLISYILFQKKLLIDALSCEGFIDENSQQYFEKVEKGPCL